MSEPEPPRSKARDQRTEGSVIGPEPLLRVVRGEPTAEELAALILVLAARAAAAVAPPSPPPSAWRDRSQLVRRPFAHGAGAWRASAWPR